MAYPKVIQGGMGVAVSNWILARAVSMCGQLGVVSGTGLDLVFCCRAQDGDKDGAIRRALEHFPIPEMGWRVWRKYYIEGGKKPGESYRRSPMIGHNPSLQAIELVMVATFVEVWLAKEGHGDLIGINFLEKLQTPHLFALFGAMLAGVDVVIVGAGLPTQFPEVLERLAAFEAVNYDLEVSNEQVSMEFDPASVMTKDEFLSLAVVKPHCLGIVSTFFVANILHKRSSRPFDGFVVELPTAGGHNAPPRNKVSRVYDMDGKDNPRLEDIRELGYLFWIAGGQCSPDALDKALGFGAAGIQVGTRFSLCRQSGLPTVWKQQRIQKILVGKDVVNTNHLASPTGYPFKEVEWEGSVSEESVYQNRTRICDIGRLRTLHQVRGKLVWRCPSEPVEAYLSKGGIFEDTIGRKCVCNGLMAAAGWPQTQKDGSVEPPIYTSGDDSMLPEYLANIVKDSDDGLYDAVDVINLVLGTDYR